MTGNTLFITYALVPTGIGTSYTRSLHCGYINKINLDVDDPTVSEVNIRFENESDFKFLSTSSSNGSGYTANKIYAIFKIVNNSDFDNVDDITYTSNNWRYKDVTDQITNYSFNITPENIVEQQFKISLSDYYSLPTYDLDYLDYPKSGSTSLSFGDETFFMGNVNTDVYAKAYTMDLSINLPIDNFNTTTNPTWNDGDVYITEIYIYDDNKNIVAVGKLNNPILKNSSIARTINFAIDF